MIGSDEVVVARIAPGLQISSRFSKSVVLIARSSAIASTTRSTSARSSSEVGAASTRASTSALAPRSSWPRSIGLVAALGRSPRARRRPCPATAADERARRSRPWRRPRRCRWPSCPVPTTPTEPMSCAQLRHARRPTGVCASATTAGLSGRLVGVEAAARLAAEQSGGHHLLEDRRRRVQPVAALLVHRVEDLVGRVEADQVEQRERAHRVAAAEPHRGVDVLAGGVLALEHRHGVVEVAEEQACWR